MAWLGAIEGLADSASSLVKLAAGVWSDRVRSRKWLVVPGYAIAAAVRPLIAVLWLPWQLMAVRIADRAGKGIRTPPRDAMIVDCTPPDARGWAFGFQRGHGPPRRHDRPAVGRRVSLLGARKTCVGCSSGRSCPGWRWSGCWRLGCGTSLGASVSEPASREGRREDLLDLKALRPQFPALSACPAGLHPGQFQRHVPLGPGRGDEGPDVATPASVVRLPPGQERRQHARRTRRRSLRAAADDPGWLGRYAAVYLAFALASAAWQVWALFLVYALFYALTEPSEKTLVANLAGPEHRGLAFGWYHLASGIATLPASLAFGWIYETLGPVTAFGWGARWPSWPPSCSSASARGRSP